MALLIPLIVVISSTLFHTHSAHTTTNNFSCGEKLNDSVMAARNIIRLYQFDLDETILWKDLNTTIEVLGKDTGHFSESARGSISLIRPMLFNALTTYFEASQKVYEWTVYAAPVLDVYLKTNQQYVLFLNGVLDEGVLALNASHQKLNVVRTELGRANNELHKLNDQLKLDFNVNGVYYQAKLSGLTSEKESNILFSLFNSSNAVLSNFKDESLQKALVKAITSTYDAIRMANANYESKITALNDQISLSQRFYNIVRERVNSARDSVQTVKDSILIQLDEMKAYKTESTNSVNELSTDQCGHIKEYVTKLIEQCNEYIQLHGVRK